MHHSNLNEGPRNTRSWMSALLYANFLNYLKFAVLIGLTGLHFKMHLWNMMPFKQFASMSAKCSDLLSSCFIFFDKRVTNKVSWLLSLTFGTPLVRLRHHASVHRTTVSRHVLEYLFGETTRVSNWGLIIDIYVDGLETMTCWCFF